MTRLLLGTASRRSEGDDVVVSIVDDKDKAKCDGPCALRLDRLEPFLAQMQTLDNTIKALPAFENN